MPRTVHRAPPSHHTPNQQQDKPDLDRYPDQERAYWLTVNPELLAGGFYVRRKNCDQQNHETGYGQRSGEPEKQSGSADEFKDAGDKDGCHRIHNPSWDHRVQVHAPMIKMPDCHEHEHDGKRVRESGFPSRER
jgi:hypothetical protein